MECVEVSTIIIIIIITQALHAVGLTAGCSDTPRWKLQQVDLVARGSLDASTRWK